MKNYLVGNISTSMLGIEFNWNTEKLEDISKLAEIDFDASTIENPATRGTLEDSGVFIPEDRIRKRVYAEEVGDRFFVITDQYLMPIWKYGEQETLPKSIITLKCVVYTALPKE